MASNPNCPFEFLQQLAHDDDSQVRTGVAKNPSFAAAPECQESIITENLIALAEENIPSNRRLFALRSPHCPIKVLERCATSIDFLERRAVAENPNTPTEVLQTMITTDADRVVRQYAQTNLDSRSTSQK
ncbi:hypothetical protein [Picosynechococcus sp. NKBG042902]|uniref:hypothetical protein n=1 Tax=Picosynechococcus sp. NKBG042902 TaxID=490193 RepID=UPI000693DC25|nr:hypothetical protein [Picosynechococcus sp. NKBG042902]